MKFIKKSISIVSLLAFYLTSSKVIEACSSCDTLSEFSKAKIDSYVGTTYLLAGIPLLFGAFLIFIIYKGSRNNSTEE